MTHQATRYHDICCGHRVYRHESKCAHLHGHNYRVWFHCGGSLDQIGRVMDFSVIKDKLCMWLENHWDHRFLLWEQDPWVGMLKNVDPLIVVVPFNPTAENIAEYMVRVIGPKQLTGTGVQLEKCVVEETAKCHASYELPPRMVIRGQDMGAAYDLKE